MVAQESVPPDNSRTLAVSVGFIKGMHAELGKLDLNDEDFHDVERVRMLLELAYERLEKVWERQ